MDKTESFELIKNIKYPNLEKTIDELKVIDEISIDGDVCDVILVTANEDAFLKLTGTIKDILKPHFSSVNVIKKPLTQKKSIAHGSTQTPNNRAPYAKKVIAVTSGKGGVGKTTVAVNIAVGLAQKGFKVGILDADVYGPNVPRMLQITDQQLKWSDDDKIIPAENFGIKVMSVAMTTPSADTPLVWRGSVATSALIQFLEDVAWGELDFMVIDMPPGTGDVQLTMSQELPITAAVVVTTPQTIAIDDVSRAIMMFKDTGVRIGGLVENMSYFVAPDTGKTYEIFGKGGGEETSLYYQIPFLGKLPLDISVREMSDVGTPAIAMGDKAIKKQYVKIVDNLLKELES